MVDENIEEYPYHIWRPQSQLPHHAEETLERWKPTKEARHHGSTAEKVAAAASIAECTGVPVHELQQTLQWRKVSIHPRRHCSLQLIWRIWWPLGRRSSVAAALLVVGTHLERSSLRNSNQ